MQTTRHQPAPTRNDLILKWVTGLLAIVYLVNCFTPLRLNVDTVRYFGIKECIEFGCPPDSDAAKDYFPYGYTALLLLFSKLHILRSFTLVLINCVYLFSGLYLIKKIFGPALRTWLFAAVVLLNWTIIKFVTHPLSEMQYLFFSISSIYCFYLWTKNKKILNLFLSLGFSVIAFLTRTVGVALLAALVAGFLWEYRTALLLLIRRNKILVGLIVVLAVGVVVFSKQLGLNHYTGVMSTQYKKGFSRSVITGWHLQEWGEITFNTSAEKVDERLHAMASETGFIIAGALFFLGFLYLLFLRKNNIPVIVKIYLLFYSLLMFYWPFYDPRFWVPVIPLIVAAIVEVIRTRTTTWKIVLALFMTGYTLLGIAASGYMTYTSLNKEVFAKRHALGVYRNEFETYYFGKPQSDTAKNIDPFVLHLIQKYN